MSHALSRYGLVIVWMGLSAKPPVMGGPWYTGVV